MPLASSFKKPQAACLINDDAYRRPQCSSLAWSSVRRGGGHTVFELDVMLVTTEVNNVYNGVVGVSS